MFIFTIVMSPGAQFTVTLKSTAPRIGELHSNRTEAVLRTLSGSKVQQKPDTGHDSELIITIIVTFIIVVVVVVVVVIIN
jgi:hypothetical protein